MRTTLFIPVLNEIEGVKAIMPRVKREWVDEIIVLDGHSTDGTREWFEAHDYKVTPQKKRGVMNAWWEGFAAATGDVIIPFSPEGNSVPEVIPQLVEKMKKGYDMVIASRYAKGAKSEDDTFLTGIGNRGFTIAINLLYGGHYTDTLGMYRAFKKDLIKQLDFDEKKDPLFEIVLSIRAAKAGLKVAEIPGDEPARIGGYLSRAHPGIKGRAKGALTMLYCLLRELFI